MPQVVVNQSAAGTTTLVAAATNRIVRVTRAMLTMSALGTLKFNDTVNDLTGPFDIAAQGGFVMPAPGPNTAPWFETGSGNALQLITTLGAARGIVDYHVISS